MVKGVSAGYPHGVTVGGKLYAQFRTLAQAQRYIRHIRGE